MKKYTFLFLILGWGVYFVIKFLGPVGVEYLFNQKAFGVLNFLALNQSPESLDFYQGRIQETVLGPAMQTLSFALFFIFIWRYFRDVSMKAFAVIVFIFLLITKSETLFFPPYGDAIGGPFAEGLWLYHHGFDYAGLFKQPNFTVGGPRVYFFSIYPGFLALTLKGISDTNLFLAFHHVLTLALTAGIAAMVRECGKKIFGPVLAFLVALVLLALPLFQSQSEAINMEIPVTFFMTGCAYALILKHWGKAAVFAILAAAVKGTGIVACGVVCVVLCVVAWRAKLIKEKLRLAIWIFLSGLTGAFIVGVKFLFRDSHVQQGMVRWDAGWPSLQKEFIFYLFLAAGFLFLVNSISRFFRKQKSDLLLPSVMGLFTAGWFLLFLNFYAVSPRYRVALYPFLVLFVAYTVTLFLKSRFCLRVMAFGVMVCGCVFSYGSFYGSVPDNDHVLLERSLEYRNDLQVNRRFVKAAEERYSDQLIVAPFALAQALAIPELGYVHKKLKVMIYGFSLKYGNIANYPGLKHLNLGKTIFVGVATAPISSDFAFPIGPRDIVVEELAVGNKKVSFFRGGIAIETLWRVTHGGGL